MAWAVALSASASSFSASLAAVNAAWTSEAFAFDRRVALKVRSLCSKSCFAFSRSSLWSSTALEMMSSAATSRNVSLRRSASTFCRSVRKDAILASAVPAASAATCWASVTAAFFAACFAAACFAVASFAACGVRALAAFECSSVVLPAFCGASAGLMRSTAAWPESCEASTAVARSAVALPDSGAVHWHRDRAARAMMTRTHLMAAGALREQASTWG
mmetsp:Transcript_21238/g.48520  ORF Transcript_21238/g.48520 Transcript_21238/m.48520 type:complete len:218 (+) Transcript_21238:784-1437(+)